MPQFRYTAVSLDGRSVSGEAAADNETALIAEFGQRGLMLVSLDALGARAGKGLFASRIDQRAVTRFLGELALMLRSGLPLDEALDLAGRGMRGGIVRIVAKVRSDVLAGVGFVEAIARHDDMFSQEIVAMARVADATGDLAGVLAAVATQRERAQILKEKVTGALRYPAFLVVTAIGVLTFFLLHVIPQFSSLFNESGNDPGVLVRGVLGVSGWMTANQNALGIALVTFLTIGFLAWRAAVVRKAIVGFLLTLPGVNGVWVLWRTSRFLTNLSVLLQQGVSATEALKVLEGVVGPTGRSALLNVGDKVRRGSRLHEALASEDLLPQTALRMLRTGEETGELAKVAGEAGGLYARQLEKRLDAISGLVGPVAIVAIAGLIGGLMVIIMTALVSVNKAIV